MSAVPTITHELKTIPPYWSDVAAGEKTFEVRSTADRTFAIGDTLVLREWTPDGEGDGYYTGRECRVVVTYLLNGPGVGVPAKLAVMSIQLEAVAA